MFNAGVEADKRGQTQRANKFFDAASSNFNRQHGHSRFSLNDNGFIVRLNDNKQSEYWIMYNLKKDEMYIIDSGVKKYLEPNSPELRTNDRGLIRSILKYFNEFNQESKYNIKDIYIK